ncbi:hypothetical protein [Phocaeicola vulgatus]|uniref:hypothetical protein n=1 Tax=Phocaeicola vulgatus TaxID=821 RepID=UPI002162A80D|nr:hypothetical protein [Phocaeicola vulgatus]UVO94683.1 hypothetical protein NXU81_03210 [Phocaeicola vulgatus]
MLTICAKKWNIVLGGLCSFIKGGYRNGVSHFKLICGNDIQFKLYQKLNSANYFDIMLECPDNSAGIMEIKAMDDLTVIETTEPLRDWQQIATE